MERAGNGEMTETYGMEESIDAITHWQSCSATVTGSTCSIIGIVSLSHLQCLSCTQTELQHSQGMLLIPMPNQCMILPCGDLHWGCNPSPDIVLIEHRWGAATSLAPMRFQLAPRVGARAPRPTLAEVEAWEQPNSCASRTQTGRPARRGRWVWASSIGHAVPIWAAQIPWFCTCNFMCTDQRNP